MTPEQSLDLEAIKRLHAEYVQYEGTTSEAWLIATIPALVAEVARLTAERDEVRADADRLAERARRYYTPAFRDVLSLHDARALLESE